MMYLDARSLLCGLMASCKKLHYLCFLDKEDARRLWHRLLRRDFPRLFDRKRSRLHIPYLESLTATVLSKRVERALYFSKIRHDAFWRIVFKEVLSNREKMSDRQIERTLKGITWRE